MKINVVFAERVIELSEFQDRFYWIKSRITDWRFWVKVTLFFITGKVAVEQIFMLVRNA